MLQKQAPKTGAINSMPDFAVCAIWRQVFTGAGCWSQTVYCSISPYIGVSFFVSDAVSTKNWRQNIFGI